jgi:hypothetical protein
MLPVNAKDLQRKPIGYEGLHRTFSLVNIAQGAKPIPAISCIKINAVA